MKKVLLLRLVGVLLVMLFAQGTAWAYYQTVDNLLLTYSGATDTAFKNGDIYYRQEINIRNTGTQSLSDVGVLWQSVFSGSMFIYNDDNHRWERELTVYGLHWVEGFTYDPIRTPDGKNDYFNPGLMSVSQQSTASFDRAKGSVSATDEVPVYWLGDLDAGEETLFSLYFAQNESEYTGGGWSIQPVLSCMAQVSQVPIPSALFLLGSGLWLISRFRNRSRRAQ
ncbi:MAG: hypothetical protein ABIK15_20040 [Pseudomonadota bacterium]